MGHTLLCFFFPRLLEEQLKGITEMIQSLGFILNEKKCVTIPQRRIEFLGFVVDTVQMTLSLPPEKIAKLQKECRHASNQGRQTTRQLAHLIGMMTSCIPAVLPAPLHYRALQRLRLEALGPSRVDYDHAIPLSAQALQDLEWWITQLPLNASQPILPVPPVMSLETDASMIGWGAVCRNTKIATGGPWSKGESTAHINWLELKAAFLAVQCYARQLHNCHIQIFLDNRVAVAYINKMGGTHSRKLCDLALEMWEWCIERRLTVHAEHLLGKFNVTADFESRHPNDSSDWQLSPRVFRELDLHYGPMTVDLFASFRNTQLTIFFSWKPDPKASAIDALAQPWIHHRPYMFPPFALIGRCLQKIRKEVVPFALLVAPIWWSQTWYPLVLEMLVDLPQILPNSDNLLLNSQSEPHPLVIQGHLTLAAWPISGDPCRIKDFRKGLLTSYVPPGEKGQRNHTIQLGGDGFAGVVQGKSIQFLPPW